MTIVGSHPECDMCERFRTIVNHHDELPESLRDAVAYVGGFARGGHERMTGHTAIVDAADEWVVINGVGGFVCGECRAPVESEPCRAHQPATYALTTRIDRESSSSEGSER